MHIEPEVKLAHLTAQSQRIQRTWLSLQGRQDEPALVRIAALEAEHEPIVAEIKEISEAQAAKG